MDASIPEDWQKWPVLDLIPPLPMALWTRPAA